MQVIMHGGLEEMICT